MERIGIMGGSFNPPHIGHLQAAQFALKELHLDRVLFVPVGIAPHKEAPQGSPEPAQRLAMTRIAVESLHDPRIQVTDLELHREGPSYSCDTVRQLKQLYPQDEMVLLVGTDMFLSIFTWKNVDELLKNVTLGVLYRGDPSEKEQIAEHKKLVESMGYRVELAENPVVSISSTQLRRMLVFRCADSFLPKGVADYIRENSLYGCGRDFRHLPMEELEPVVVSLLKPNRVAHVLGVRDTAEKLAKLWGADVTDASRAGILHDVTKALDGPLQLTLCREYGRLLDDFSTKNPKTLHALTGSLVADRIFGENHVVVEAIRHHTTGKANMNLLEKIVYVADYMEPNRDFPGVEKLRELAFKDLDGALKLGLEMTLDLLKEQKREISPESREALAYLNETH